MRVISFFKRLLGDFGWGFLALNVPQLSQTFISLLVAPYLEPHDLGVVALAAGVVLFFENLRDAGLVEALLREEAPSPVLLSSAAWFLLLGGFFWGGMLVLSAHPVARLLKVPELSRILPVLALSFPLEALNRVPSALLMRSFAYRRLFFAQLIPICFSLPATFILARLGWGYWSIVYGGLIGAVVRAGIFLYLWRPKRTFSLRPLLSLILFGLHVLWQVFLGWANLNILRFLLGRFLGAHVLGLFGFAVSLTLRPLSFLSIPLLRMALPYFARFQRDREALRRAYWRLFSRAVPAAWGLCAALALFAPPLIPKVFGPQWAEAAPLLRVLALVAAVQSLGWLTGELFRALGRPEVISRVMFVQVALGLFVYALTIPHGLWAFVKALVVVESLNALFNFLLAQYILRFPLSVHERTWRDERP